MSLIRAKCLLLKFWRKIRKILDKNIIENEKMKNLYYEKNMSEKWILICEI